MSSTLHWKPVGKYKGTLSDELKFALRKRNEFCHDAGGDYGTESIDFLRGLAVAGIEDAEKLIKLIQKHGDIRITEVH
jgi:hypothetical protein